MCVDQIYTTHSALQIETVLANPSVRDPVGHGEYQTHRMFKIGCRLFRAGDRFCVRRQYSGSTE